MAAFHFFDSFVTALAAGTHAGALNADTDTLKVYLTNTAPDAAAHSVKADLAEIAAGNGYTAGGEDAQNAASTSGGVITVVGTDITWTASGGSIASFAHAVLYNDSAADDPLVGYWSYGSSISPGEGETFTTDFGDHLFTLGA